MVIMVGDQNFPSCLSGKNGCVPVVRLEDPSLMELFDISLEIFDRYPMPAGTLFLVGSTSHLQEMGSTIYALDWVRVCKEFTGRWKHVKVGPLPPVLREQTGPEITRLITEVWRWYNCIYGSDICYPRAAWDIAIKNLGDNTEQVLDLAGRDTYTVALPLSLKSTALTHHKFVSSASLPATLAFSGEATRALLHALLYQLNTKFGCRAHPEDILAREPAEQEGAMETSDTNTMKIIICGGSICRRLAQELHDMGQEVIDLTKPGWTPTSENITRLTTDIAAANPGKNSIFIGDLLSNTSFCFEQVNGSHALPVKLDGKYHMLGKVSVSNKESVQIVLSKIVPILNSTSCFKVCLPPLPRYMFTPCCANEGHCEGLSEVDYPVDLYTQTLGLRKVMRDFLHSRVANVWVPDSVASLTPDSNSVLEQVEKIKSYFSSDGVHLNSTGNRALASCVKKIIDEHTAASICVSGRGPPGEFFWRGFVSPVGSARPKNAASLHPARGYGGGGGKWKTGLSASRGGGRFGPMGPPPSASRRK